MRSKPFAAYSARCVTPTRDRFVNGIAIFAIALIGSVAQAKEPQSVGPVTLDRSYQYLYESTIVGETFRLDVVLPIRYSVDEQYPIVYVTDSNYLLSSAAATDLAQATKHLPRVILVGIGYDVPSISDTAQIRTRDFTPSCDKTYQERTNLPDHLCGGADKFIAFIREELKPFISKTYPISDDDTLVGYSFGGLFALHVLFTQAQLFDRYVIGSPSIEWDDELLFEEESKFFDSHKDLNKIVYMSAGGLEGYGTIPRVYEMYERLSSRGYPNLDLEIEIHQDETHMTAINSTVMRGLRSVLPRETE